MKKYVERCFSLYEDEIDKDALEKHFRSYFTHVFENKLENVIDWEKQTLPNHLMKAEKQDDVHSRLSFLDSTNSELSKKSPKRKKKKVKHAMMILENANSEENLKSIEKRKSRFSIEQKNKGVKSRLNFANRNTNLIQYEPVETVHLKDVRIKGTCTLIDKKYFRLTTLPDPSTVRSENVLCESLEFHKKQWTKEHNYRYTCDQFKSIRQDLTVQGIVNEFSIVVYETHARIALEAGDNAEFNQCQSQLKQLYKTLDSKCRKEFMCYRILYAIFVKNYGDLAEELYNVYKEIIDENLQFSVDFAHAWVIGNYSKLFCLYRNPPHMSSYIIDWFITNEREEAIKKMIKVYRPSLEIDVVQNYLKMDNVDDVVSLCSNIGVEINDGVIDCKYYTNLFTQNN
ncbi:hypothetical protein A3Q56_07295 [Intoshia linei]|uniref:SAC3/GANP/THP3 conserved domain-containing protein n=1 Tax=Intoshia linei TaxID=1819745 RepID=A0A177ASN6_9BILA|nr:hypothetical protein A3Q56_07295 [Intoshia linei]